MSNATPPPGGYFGEGRPCSNRRRGCAGGQCAPSRRKHCSSEIGRTDAQLLRRAPSAAPKCRVAVRALDHNRPDAARSAAAHAPQQEGETSRPALSSPPAEIERWAPAPTTRDEHVWNSCRIRPGRGGGTADPGLSRCAAGGDRPKPGAGGPTAARTVDPCRHHAESDSETNRQDQARRQRDGRASRRDRQNIAGGSRERGQKQLCDCDAKYSEQPSPEEAVERPHDHTRHRADRACCLDHGGSALNSAIRPAATADGQYRLRR